MEDFISDGWLIVICDHFEKVFDGLVAQSVERCADNAKV